MMRLALLLGVFVCGCKDPSAPPESPEPTTVERNLSICQKACPSGIEKFSNNLLTSSFECLCKK